MENKVRYLVIDTETGGLDPNKHSLLSVAGVAWSPGEKPKELFNFYVKEDSLTVDPKAMAINKINLSTIDEVGIAPKKVLLKILAAVIDEFGRDVGLGNKVMLAGHNVDFDIGFMKRLFEKADLVETSFEKFFSHRKLDTSSILSFLMCTNALEPGSSSSTRLFDFCGTTPSEENRHTALGDAFATAHSLNVLIKMFGEK